MEEKHMNKIKSNWTNILIISIIFASFLLINLNVVNFGDDYWFLRFRNYGTNKTFSELLNFYKTTNGRFIVHLLVVYFLKNPMIFWQVFNSIILTRYMLLFIQKFNWKAKRENAITTVNNVFLNRCDRN